MAVILRRFYLKKLKTTYTLALFPNIYAIDEIIKHENKIRCRYYGAEFKTVLKFHKPTYMLLYEGFRTVNTQKIRYIAKT